jgi:RNA methyltransferase, TrmH family
MVSKSQIKLITSLEQKKGRTKSGLFKVEGIKGITEFLNSRFQLEKLFAIEPFDGVDEAKIEVVNDSELKKISSLTTAQKAVAIFKIPEQDEPVLKGLVVALDGVRDPGNLGTIIRLCDWFGIDALTCSKDTVDCYNPKVVQATMGSLTRVNVHYCDLEQLISNNSELPIIGTFLEGENLYSTSLPENGILIMGNEANGITAEIEKLITQKLNIPQFGEIKETESLNVATATSILLSEFRRRSVY